MQYEVKAGTSMAGFGRAMVRTNSREQAHSLVNGFERTSTSGYLGTTTRGPLAPVISNCGFSVIRLTRFRLPFLNFAKKKCHIFLSSTGAMTHVTFAFKC